MPGFVGHRIYLKKNLNNLLKVDLGFPREFKDLEYGIRGDILELRTKADKQCDQIIPSVAVLSQQAQQGMIKTYQSVITGTLLNSVQPIITHDQAVVGTTLEYASYVDEGRGPVHAPPGKVLHFFTKDGREVFAKSVGPAEPRPYATASSNLMPYYIDTVVGHLLDTI